MDQNLDIIKRGYEAFGRGDLDALLSLFDENINWVTPGPPELPTAGTRRGRQDVARFFQTLNELFEFEQFTPREFTVQGDRVIVTGDEVARVRGSSEPFSLQWAHVFELRNGLVVSFREFFDTFAAVAALRAAGVPARV